MTALRLIALALTAVVFAAGGAHLFALPNKIGLDAEAYFIAQQVYAGWALFAVPIFGAIIANGVLAWAERRRDPAAARWALLSAVLIVASLAIFFAWVFPGNKATTSWTTVPEGWEELRRHWEYGHAANAVIVFAALLATGRAIIGAGR